MTNRVFFAVQFNLTVIGFQSRLKCSATRLGQYIIRTPISQERMTYVPSSETADGIARVIYKAKDGGATLVRVRGFCL
jgi:hypothetical protein